MAKLMNAYTPYDADLKVINNLEEVVFVKQMDIASEKNMLMTVHLPHNNKPEGMTRIEKILNNDAYNKYDRKKYL